MVGSDRALGVSDVLERRIIANLREKIALELPKIRVFPLSEEEILSTVVGYEKKGSQGQPLVCDKRKTCLPFPAV